MEPWAGRAIGKRGVLWWKPWLTVAARLPPPGEAPTDTSYLGPVGPAAHLLHDGLVGQPVVQPRHVLTIGPEEGVGGGEATRLSCAGSPGVIRHLAQHLSPGRDGSDSAPAAFAQKDFEKAHNLLHIF